MLIRDPLLRGVIAESLAEIANGVVREEITAKMGETQITTSIRREMAKVEVIADTGERYARIFMQEVSPGRNTQEALTGMDMYVSVEATDEAWNSKGLLVQAKRRDQLHQHGLRKQCRKMLALNEESYVWIYGDDGIQVISARAVVDSKGPIEDIERDSFADHLESILICHEGDPRIGLPNVENKAGALNAKMEDFHARAAISIEIAVLPE